MLTPIVITAIIVGPIGYAAGAFITAIGAHRTLATRETELRRRDQEVAGLRAQLREHGITLPAATAPAGGAR